MGVRQSIFGKGTLSLKEVNQDSVVAISLPELNSNLIAVADGLGSFYQSEFASAFVCQNLIEVLKRQNNIDNLFLENVFEEITLNLKEKVQEKFEGRELSKNNFGTTLLCCIETANEFIIGYLGNGGIFHLRGNFNCFPERFYLPWNSINLLNPHSIEKSGKNALYKLIEPNYKAGQIVPSVIKIRKDQMHFGDIIMICSDGVYSYDEVQVGKDSNGKIWISGEETMERLYRHLKNFLSEADYTEELLNAMILKYLEELKTENLIHDDTSLALIITDKAQSFQLHQIEHIENDKD